MLRLPVIITSLFLLIAPVAFSQHDFSPRTWHFFDTSIANKRNLSDLNELVSSLQQKAIQEKNYLHATRCLRYKIIISDLKTEDSLYFKNSAIIDTLILTNHEPLYLYTLHLLQVQRLIGFKTKYKKFGINRYERKDIPVNYAAYDNKALDSIAAIHFSKAKGLTKEIRNATIDDALWLSSDPLQFLFKPDFFDIAVAEQIKATQKSYYNNPLIPVYYESLSFSPERFISVIDSLTSAEKNKYPEIRSYLEWISYHRSVPGNYLFIETLMRKYIYNLVKAGKKDAEKLYEKYLQASASSPYGAVKAHSVFQLCMLWNSQSGKYYPPDRFNYDDYDYQTDRYREKKFDTAYRYHAVKALQLFKQHAALLDSFQYLKNLLLVMQKNILSDEILLTVQKNNLPGESFIGNLKFKNANTLYYRIMKVHPNYLFLQAYDKLNTIKELLRIPVTSEQVVTLPAMNDYNYHATFLRIDALPPGEYSMIYSSKPFTDTSAAIRLLNFTVTNIAAVNSAKRIYILHRKTGMPLINARVKAAKRTEIKRDSTGIYFSEQVQEYTVNNRGFIDLKNDQYNRLTVSLDDDSLVEELNINEPANKPDDVYDKDEYDDLIEYYEDNATTYIYTDRSIYRPGQTVFFKAIFITKNPDTGEPIVMSKENLRGRIFGNVYDKWLKNENPLLMLTDPFGKEMDSIKIKPNEYGSVSGSFKIPKTAATGEWSIEPDYIEVSSDSWNQGSFSVEEYKKPSYEINIEKPKKELRPGDEFSFTVKLKSFSGAPLNNVKVKYTVNRKGYVPELDSSTSEVEKKFTDISLYDTSGYTNEEGELKIDIKDPSLKQIMLDNKESWSISYDIDAETADATGENYSKDENIEISTRPIRIRIPVSTQYEKKELAPVLVTTEDINAGKVDKTVKIKLYRITTEKKLYSDRKMNLVDVWLYDKEKLQKEFPLLNLENKEPEETKELVFEKTIHTGKSEKLEWNDRLLTAGRYKIEASCEENGILTGELEKKFSVFDLKAGKLMEPAWNFTHVPYNSVSPADTIKLYQGNSESGNYSIYHVAYYSGKKKTTINYTYNEKYNDKGLSIYNLRVPADAVHILKLTRIFVLNNEVFETSEDVTINGEAEENPEIIIEKYRKKMEPGSKETFTVSIKTKNQNTAAELMTTLYDASLDKLEEHKWEAPREIRDFSGRYIDAEWTRQINYETMPRYDYFLYNEAALIQPGHASNRKPLWWVNPLDFAYTATVNDYSTNNFLPYPNLRRNYQRDDLFGLFDRNDVAPYRGNDFSFQHDMNPGVGYWSAPSFALEGRVAGLSLSNTEGLSEVVVAGYATKKSMALTGATAVRIRGISSLDSYAQPLIILDGVVFTGDLKSIDTKTITDGLVLKGADAESIYGIRAANGVLVLSTKGEIVFPKEPEPVIVPRKNFNETAFFFPAIYADKNGYYTFSFKMPESVTEWNWKLLAHTKNLLFAYAEKKLNTQLPLMVQPNIPRVLYKGDKIVLQSRISNLDSVNATGKIVCKIEDAVTGNEITQSVAAVSQNNFTVNKKSNTSSGFEIKVPSGQLNPLRITITVRSENFADGEEHIIPVLSPRIFVRQTIPFSLQKNKDTVISIPALPSDAEIFGAGLNIQDKPQAALLYSLPYLANYPFGCAEQNFNKMLAHMIALMLMQTDTTIQRSFVAAQQISKKEMEEDKLPDIPGEEAMPWLSLSNNRIKKQMQLYNLLDTFRTKDKIYELADKIYKTQSGDGGLSWFPQGRSNFYISAYVLRGFGRLTAAKQFQPKRFSENNYLKFTQELVKYCDDFYANLSEKDKTSTVLYYSYARSYWLKQYPLSDALLISVRDKIKEQWKNVNKYSLYSQALLSIISNRYADNNQQDLLNKAIAQVRSIRQLAIDDDINGIRWKDLADADDLSISAEETIALLAEAFSEIDKDDKTNAGIIKWLLTACNEHHWSSTKGTAAAVELLTKENKAASINQSLNATVGDQTLSVSDELVSGNSFSFIQNNTLPATIKVQKQQDGIAVGDLSAYYFTAFPNVAGKNEFISIEKQFYKWNEKQSAWEKLNEGASIKISDRIKVVLKLRAQKMLEFVYVDDKRAAALEPEDKSSGYEYSGSLSYYKSIRDAGFQIFIDKIPSGIHEISYEMKAAYEGNFTNGPVSLQCMYRPDISAYANGIKLNVGKNE